MRKLPDFSWKVAKFVPKVAKFLLNKTVHLLIKQTV